MSSADRPRHHDKVADHINKNAARHNIKVDPSEVARFTTAAPELHRISKMIDGDVPTDVKAGDMALKKILLVTAGMCDAVIANEPHPNPIVTDTAAAIHTILDKYPG